MGESTSCAHVTKCDMCREQNECQVSLNTVDSIETFVSDINHGRWEVVLPQVSSLKLPRARLEDLYEQVSLLHLHTARRLARGEEHWPSAVGCPLSSTSQRSAVQNLRAFKDTNRTLDIPAASMGHPCMQSEAAPGPVQVVLEMIELRDVDTARAMLRQTRVLAGMRQEDPDRFQRLDTLCGRTYFDIR